MCGLQRIALNDEGCLRKEPRQGGYRALQPVPALVAPRASSKQGLGLALIDEAILRKKGERISPVDESAFRNLGGIWAPANVAAFGDRNGGIALASNFSGWGGFSALPADISRLIGPVKQPGCLRIHFLNVGHGDCTVIQHPSGRVTVVDINNGETMDEDSCEEILDCQNPLRHYPPLYPMVFNPFPAPLAGMSVFESQKEQLKKAGYSRDLTNPIQFLKERIRIRSIFRYIQTHPDLDHMRGLSVLVKEFSIENFWDTVHTKTEQDVQQFDMPDWNAYIGLRNGKETMNHVKPRKLELYQDSRNQYWVDDGIEILSPSFGISFLYHKHSKRNNLSYVLRVSHNGINVILGGDAEKEAWEDIVGNHKKSLKCDVLKASHHGRNSGYHLEAVQAMSPKYVIVSVGKKPDQDASNRYRCQGAEVLSTRWHGNISLTIDSQGEMSWVSEKKR